MPYLIRLLIKVSKHKVTTTFDDNEELTLQKLLLRPGTLPVELIVVYLEEWDTIEMNGGITLS